MMKGQANSDRTTYNNSNVSAGKAVNITSGADTNVVGGTIKATQVTANVGGNLNVESLQDKAVSEVSQKTTGKSGGDTTLKGATVEGKQVTATVGGNLNIESLQDTATYAEKNQQVGDSVMVGVTQSGAVSGNINLAKSNIDSSYASVTEQSTLKAGDGGFTVNVQGNTDFKGGAITSTQAAIDQNKNSFQTGGTLTTSDIQNRASYDAKSVSVSVGVGSSPLPGQGLSSTLSGAGLGKDSGSANSTTTAGISGVAGDTGKRTGDNAQGLAKIFDADKVRQEIQAQTQIMQEFSKQASTAVQSYAQTQRKELQDQIKTANGADKATLQKQLDDVNTQERVLNILVGAVTGLGQTAATKETLAAAADEMRAMMIEDSKKFAGIVDSTGSVLSNASGESVGVNGNGFKGGGTRASLDKMCGPSKERCKTNSDGSLLLNDKGQVQFDAKDANDNPLSIDDFLKTPEGQKMSDPFGGVQGAKGTLFGEPYLAGSWQDKLIEAFAGPHDTIGGKFTGLYDNQGNIKQGMNSVERAGYEAVSGVALIPSSFFAAAQSFSPQVWNAISILLKEAR